MPNQNNIQKPQHPIAPQPTFKQYDADDLNEIHSCAYDSVANMGVLLGCIQSENKKLSEYLEKAYNVPKSVFDDLNRLLNITHVLANEDADYYHKEAEKYEE